MPFVRAIFVWFCIAFTVECTLGSERLHAGVDPPDPAPRLPRDVSSSGRGEPMALLALSPSPPRDAFPRSAIISLEEAVATARDESNAVLEASARRATAAGRRLEALGALAPRLGIEASGGYLRGRDINNAGRELNGLDYGRFEPSVGVFQRVNPGSAISTARRWRHEVDAASHDEDEAKRLAARLAAIGYHELALAHASARIAETLAEDALNFLEITRQRASAEIGSGADVARAESEAARARQLALRARGDWEQISARLAVLLRREPSVLLQPSEDELQPTLLVEESEAETLLAESERGRADLRAARARASATSLVVSSRWWELFGPVIDASLRERLIGREIDDVNDTTLADLSLGFSFDFGELGRLQSAREEARAARIRRRALLEQIRGSVIAAIAEVRIAREALPHARLGFEAAQRSHRIQLDRFRAGTGLGLEVIEAQNARAHAHRTLAEAISAYNVAQVELAATIGRVPLDGFAGQSAPPNAVN